MVKNDTSLKCVIQLLKTLKLYPSKQNKTLDNDFVVISNFLEIRNVCPRTVCAPSTEHDLPKLISIARDNVTLRSAATYKIRTSLTISHCLETLGKQSVPVNSLNCI